MVAAESGGVAVRKMGYWWSAVSPRMDRIPAGSVGTGSCLTLASRWSELGSSYWSTSLCMYLGNIQQLWLTIACVCSSRYHERFGKVMPHLLILSSTIKSLLPLCVCLHAAYMLKW